MSELVLTFLVMGLVPTIGVLSCDGVWRARWARPAVLRTRVETVGEGAYREGPHAVSELVSVRRGAPKALWAASFSSFFLGQMVLPATLAWCVGWLVMADNAHHAVLDLAMLAYLPGVWAAVCVWRAGAAVMAGDRREAAQAVSRAVAVTLWLNAIEVAVSFGVLALRLADHEAVFANLIYAPISVAQVLFLRWAFRRHAAEFPMGHTAEELDAVDGSVSACA